MTHPAPPTTTPADTRPLTRAVFFALGVSAASFVWCANTLAADSDPTNTYTNPYAHIDWVPLEQLTPEQRERLPAGCCGAYINPVINTDGTLPIEQAPIHAEADHSHGEGNRLFVLEGNVLLRQGPRQLRAGRASANQTTRELILEQDIEIRETGLLLRADNARMNLDNQDATLNASEFVLHESRIHGQAEHLEKFGDRLISLTRGTFTTCEPDREFWKFYAGKIDLYPQENFGSARHARLAIGGVPVLYIPYMRFPIGDERQSGLLFPSISNSNKNGAEYAQPIYWNIAPNMDATITPRYLSKRGLVWETELRHKSSFFTTTFNGGYLADDDGGSDQHADSAIEQGVPPDTAYPNRGSDRWMLQLQQTGGLSHRIKTRIDYTELSDAEYLLDINSSDIDLNRQAVVRKSGGVSWAGDAWRLTASAEEYRQLNQAEQKPYKELPRLSADGRYRWQDWRLDLANEYTRFDLTQYYDKPSRQLVTGERLRTDYGVSWDNQWLWGFIKPRLGVKTLSYQLQQAELNPGEAAADSAIYNSSPSLVVPQASLDMGLMFERAGSIGGTDYIQTLEPRLFYFYSDYKSHEALYHPLNNSNQPLNFDTSYLTFSYNQLFRTTRFAGGDRIDDANQLAAGVTSRFISPDTGIEYLRLSLGQVYRFDPPKVALNPGNLPEDQIYERSEYAGQISGMLGRNLRLSGDALYDEHDAHLTNGSTSIEYSDAKGRIASLTYRYKRQLRTVVNEGVSDVEDRSLDQLDVGMFLPVNERWSLIARSHYDFTYDRELDTFAGFEYSDCCYRVRFLWRRWLDFDYTSSNLLETISDNDYDRGYFIDLQLKGLASISERVGSLLSKTILGYEEREASLR